MFKLDFSAMSLQIQHSLQRGLGQWLGTASKRGREAGGRPVAVILHRAQEERDRRLQRANPQGGEPARGRGISKQGKGKGKGGKGKKGGAAARGGTSVQGHCFTGEREVGNLNLQSVFGLGLSLCWSRYV